MCNRVGPTGGGTAELQIHHATRDPDGMDEHDMANLVTLCRGCHHWHHQQATGDDLPVTITAADRDEVLKHDIEILEILDRIGPATTGEIQAALSVDVTILTVRERLWQLMALDNIVDERERQIVDQDADSGKWGLTSQISTSTRGRIPDDTQKLLQRAEEERVRMALDRGCDRQTVAAVMGVTDRTTRHKEKRARAYDFPLAALESHRGDSDTSDEPHPDAAEPLDDAVASDGTDDQDGQQQLADVSVDDEASSDDVDVGTRPAEVQATATDGGDNASLENHVKQAINALSALRAEL